MAHRLEDSRCAIKDLADTFKYLHFFSFPTCLEYTIAPSVSFANISGNTVFSDANTTFPLKINVCDNENDTLTCDYYLDGNLTPAGTITVVGTKPQKAVEFPTPINVAALSKGIHILRVTTKDNISPAKEIFLSFQVDKSAPTISIQHPNHSEQHSLFFATSSFLLKQHIVVVFFMRSSSAFYKEGYDGEVTA